MTGARWVLHLPTTLTSFDDVAALATALRDSLRHMPALEFGELTVSAEDDQNFRHRVWCDARLAGARRCPLPAGHPSPCHRSVDQEVDGAPTLPA